MNRNLRASDADKILKRLFGEKTCPLFSDTFEEMFDAALEKELSTPQSKEDIYDRIANQYIAILSLLGIGCFTIFRFPDYKNSRVIIVDGKTYDLDVLFCHNDIRATEVLCTIDVFIADTERDTATILKETETRVNARNKG